MGWMLTFAPHPEDSRGSRNVMAAVCEVCGKKPSFGMSISHSHRRTKRRWDPNIQRVRAMVDGSPRRLHVCCRHQLAILLHLAGSGGMEHGGPMFMGMPPRP